MFLHHRVILGFFLQMPYRYGDGDGKMHLLWKWNWQFTESLLTVPWHRCYCWNGRDGILAIRWIGIHANCPATRIW